MYRHFQNQKNIDDETPIIIITGKHIKEKDVIYAVPTALKTHHVFLFKNFILLHLAGQQYKPYVTGFIKSIMLFTILKTPIQ